MFRCFALTVLCSAVGTACVEVEASTEPLPLIGEDPSDSPLRDLPPALEKLFVAGDGAFEARVFPAQGLGPLYIRAACASCHAADGKGPGFVQKMAAFDDDGLPLVLATGNTVRPFLEAGATTPILPPTDGNVVLSVRIGPAVFGRGFIEAIDDDVIVAHETAQQGRDDGISGRVHRVDWQSEANPDTSIHNHRPGTTNLVGRFGLKARIATLDEFTADAFQGDMGVTSPLRPTEPVNPDGIEDDLRPGVDTDADTVNAVAAYMRLLAIPRRTPLDDEDDAARAAALFDAVRCAVCHVPSMPTSTTWPLAPLAGKDAAIFSDLLLHDMGEGLKDDIVDHDASGREWKTAPLMGLRFFTGFLHDGRAASVADAVAAHRGEGSEANDSVDRFDALDDDEKSLLLNYVESL